jgi:hypothetical protein
MDGRGGRQNGGPHGGSGGFVGGGAPHGGGGYEAHYPGGAGAHPYNHGQRRVNGNQGWYGGYGGGSDYCNPYWMNVNPLYCQYGY